MPTHIPPYNNLVGGNKMKLCKCGCGLEVSKGCNFKKGHYARYDNPMNYEKYRKKVSEGQLGKK